MADKLVTVFELDVSDYLEQLRVLNIQIQQAKDNQKELAKAAADGNKEAGIQLQEVNTFLKIQQKEYASLQRSLVGFTTANQKSVDTLDLSNNSIKQNRALLSQLTEQYNVADKVGREKMAPTIKKISDELKKQEGAIGDTRRNVGNYKDSILEAVGSLRGIGAVVDPIKNITGAFKDAGGGVQGFSAALLATGLPLFIASVNGLVDAFNLFEDTTDRAEDAIFGLKRGYAEMIATLRDSETTFGDSIKAFFRANEEGQKLSETLRDIKERQEQLNVANAENDKDISILLVKTRDRTKSEKERLGVLDEIEKKEKSNLEINLKNATESRDLAEKEYGRALQLGLKSDEARAALFEAQKRVIALEKDYGVLAEKNQTRRNQLTDDIKQQTEKENQLREAAIAKEADRLKRESDMELKGRKELRENIIGERELLSFQLQTQEQLDAEFAAAQQEDSLLTYKEFIERKKKIYQGYIQTISDIDKDNAAREKELAAEQAKLDQESLDFKKKSLDEIAKAEEQSLQNSQGAINQLVGDIINVGQSITSTIGEVLNTVSTLAIQNLEYQYQQGEISARKFNAMVADEKRKAWKQSKALSITQTIFNTASAVMAQLSNPTPYVGIVLAALAAATGAAQIALIAKQKPPQFAKGGAIQIGGKSHSEGGTPIHVGGKLVAEAERGENMYILKKEASAQINALSAFNQMFGGRSFGATPTKFAAEGGQINTGDGGFFTRSVKSNNEISALRKAFIDGAQSLPAPVVSVKEIDRVNTNKNRAVAVSEL